MKLAKFFLILIFSVNLFAHKIPGITVEVEALEDDKIHIKGFFKKSKKILKGNTIRLVSKIDDAILYEGIQEKNGLITSIPKESYWIYLIVRDSDVVIEGIAPKNGFEKQSDKKPRAFILTLCISLFFLFLAFKIMIKKSFLSKKE